MSDAQPPTTPEPRPDLLREETLLETQARLRAAVAEMGGLGWKSLDEFQREMRDE